MSLAQKRHEIYTAPDPEDFKCRICCTKCLDLVHTGCASLETYVRDLAPKAKVLRWIRSCHFLSHSLTHPISSSSPVCPDQNEDLLSMAISFSCDSSLLWFDLRLYSEGWGLFDSAWEVNCLMKVPYQMCFTRLTISCPRNQKQKVLLLTRHC